MTLAQILIVTGLFVSFTEPIPKKENAPSKQTLGEAVEYLMTIKPNPDNSLYLCSLWAEISKLSIKIGDLDGAMKAMEFADKAVPLKDILRSEVTHEIAQGWSRLGQSNKVFEITSTIPKSSFVHDALLRESALAAAESGHYDVGLQIAKELPKDENNELIMNDLKRLDIIYRAKKGITEKLIAEIENLPNEEDKIAVYVGWTHLNRHSWILELNDKSLFDMEFKAGNRKQAIAMVRKAEEALMKLQKEDPKRFTAVFRIARAHALLKDPEAIRRILPQIPSVPPKETPSYSVYEMSHIQIRAMLAGAEAAADHMDRANAITNEFPVKDDQVYILIQIAISLNKAKKAELTGSVLRRARDLISPIHTKKDIFYHLSSAAALCGYFEIATDMAFRSSSAILYSHIAHSLSRSGRFQESRVLTFEQINSNYLKAKTLLLIAEEQSKADQVPEVKSWIEAEDDPMRKAYAMVGLANGLFVEK